jgi:hypothetical protein
LSTQSAPAISRVHGRPAAANRTCSARSSGGTAGAAVDLIIGQATAEAITSTNAANPATIALWCRRGGSGGGGSADGSSQTEVLSITLTLLSGPCEPGARPAESNRRR